MSPRPPHLSSISNFFQSSPTPAECPTTQGGFAAHPAPLRSAGLLLPPGPLSSPVVAHSCGVSDDPGGIRSSSGSAALRRAATPPWTPLRLEYPHRRDGVQRRQFS